MNLLSEVTQKAMAVYLDKKEWEKRYYVNYFPLQYTPLQSVEHMKLILFIIFPL